MISLAQDFKDFLDSSPTSWHCVQQAGNRLSTRDFSPLEESSVWNLEKEKRFFVTRGGSLAAFCLPKKRPSKIVVMAAHTDSPSLKVKPSPNVHQSHMSFLAVETYGGPILHSWLNKDLALAGKIFFTNKNGDMKEKLIFLDDIPMIIPELAIHLNRDVNQKGPLINEQDHMMPLFSVNAEKVPSLESILRRRFSFDKLLSFDLFLVPLDPARFIGLDGEMLASYRLDNLTSVHAAICAMASYQDSSILPLSIFWDHEEIGSLSWEGAKSSFLEDLLSRIGLFYGMTREEMLVLKSRSLCLSLDMAHALNPLHAKKHDPNHPSFLGKGIALKTNANLRYASSAKTLAEAVLLCEKAKIPYQHFAARSDMPCGSTIGPSAAASGIPTVDLGCPQLSMHSSREIVSIQDYCNLISFLSESIKP